MSTACPSHSCLQGGGEMGALLRAFDWSSTSIGPVERWPQSLRFAVSLLLNSRHPMFLWWGPDLIQFYNDAYRPSLGSERHPSAIGARGRECWAEIWPIIGHQIESVMSGGDATWHVDAPVFFERNGVVEELYWTYGYSPVADDDGGIGGTLVVCTETTARVVATRRLGTLRDLASIEAFSSAEEACSEAANVLGRNQVDLPFALIYLVDSGGQTASLCAAAGIEAGSTFAPERIDLKNDHLTAWPAERCRVLVTPIGSPGGEAQAGVLVTALGPRLPMSEPYRDFLTLAAAQVSGLISRAHAHRASVDEREQLYQLFMQAPVPMCVLRGRDLVFEMANPRYLALFNRDILGKPMLEAFPEARGAGRDDLLRAAMATGVPYVGEEIVIRVDLYGTGNAADTFWTVTYAPTREKDGRIERITVACQHVTANVLARRQVEAARLEAEATNAAKDRFMATLSHEMLTPVGAIGLWLEVLRKSEDPAMRLRAVDSIQSAATAQSKLLDDLWDGSRVATGRMAIDLRPLDLAAVLDDAVQTAKLAAAAKGVALTYGRGLTDAAILGDPARLTQVFGNVLSNAIKFTPADGHISVELARDESNIVITVRDDGRGVGAEFVPDAFEPFRQADSTASREHGGLGLGLAIVRKLVTLHGGTVRLASDGVGKGTSVVVSLPSNANAHDRGSSPNVISTEILRDVHVLLIDDSVSLRNALAILLELHGATVSPAGSVAEALSILDRAEPSVVVTDIGLPGEDGYALLRKVRLLEGKNRDLPVVALTAYASEEDRVRALDAGFQAHVSKTADFAVLARTLAAFTRAE